MTVEKELEKYVCGQTNISFYTHFVCVYFITGKTGCWFINTG